MRLTVLRHNVFLMLNKRHLNNKINNKFPTLSCCRAPLEMKGCKIISHCIQIKTAKCRVVSRILRAIIAFAHVYFNIQKYILKEVSFYVICRPGCVNWDEISIAQFIDRNLIIKTWNIKKTAEKVFHEYLNVLWDNH